MIGTTLSRSNVGVAQAQALFAQMTTPPSGARQTLITQTIQLLIVNGIWDLLDLFYMLAAATADAAIINWKAPGTNTLAEAGTPTFTADEGYTGNGTDGLLSAAYTNVLYTQNNGHTACFGLTTSASVISDFSLANATPASRGRVLVRNGVSGSGSVGSTTVTAAIVGVNVPRLISANRADDASNQVVYSNGADPQTGAVASAATVVATVNVLGDGVGGFGDRQIAFACCGASLTAAQHAALYSIVRAYLTGVGAI